MNVIPILLLSAVVTVTIKHPDRSLNCRQKKQISPDGGFFQNRYRIRGCAESAKNSKKSPIVSEGPPPMVSDGPGDR
jgi:hypothetical protein